jgi:hypothetical protein
MEATVIRAGEKIHVAERRRFESDLRRHFVGEVIEAAGNLIRARGYAFVFNSGTGKFEKKPEVRTRVFSAIDANNTINILVDNLKLERVKYVFDANRRLVLTDDQDLNFDINEFGPAR